MAERIGCNERTIRRDLDTDYARLQRDGQREIVANRAGILAELGRTYAQTIQDYDSAKQAGRDTFGYLKTRCLLLGLMGRISGAEMPGRLIVQGSIHHTVDATVQVQMISEAELLKMAAITAEVGRQAPGMRAQNGNGTGNGNGES
jgi:hypothetical protein